MQNFFSGLLRFFFKIVLAIFGLVFALSLLAAALVALVYSLLKALVTGTKPAPFVAFSQFKQFKKNANNAWPFTAKPAPQGDVVDVEVREIKPLNEKVGQSSQT